MVRLCTAWIGYTSSDSMAIREMKISILRALVIGMGLEWPDGIKESKLDEHLLYGVIVPSDRIVEFLSKVERLAPEVVMDDLGTVDVPDEETGNLIPEGVEFEIEE